MLRFRTSYINGTKLVNLYTKQIKCIILNFKKMRTIYITILAAIVSLSAFATTKVDITYSKEWNSKTRTWVQTERIVTTEEAGKISNELIQVKQNGEWTNHYFNTISYNNGQVIEEFEQSWNESKMKWEDNYRKLYSYNEAGKLSQILHQNIFNGEYVNSSKEILTYTPEGYLKEKTIQNYDVAWSNFLRYQYYFLEKDVLMEENLTYWNNDNWDGKSFLTSYTYNSNGDLSSTVKSEKTSKKEITLNKQEFIYNSSGQLSEEVVLQWNKRKNTWKENCRTKYEINEDGNIVGGLFQEMNNNSWKDISYTELPETTGDVIKKTGFLSHMICEIHADDFQKKARLTFSNPDKEIFQIKIVDEYGEIVSSDMTSRNSISFNIGNLNQGQYFVELQGRNLFSGKFSIE